MRKTLIILLTLMLLIALLVGCNNQKGGSDISKEEIPDLSSSDNNEKVTDVSSNINSETDEEIELEEIEELPEWGGYTKEELEIQLSLGNYSEAHRTAEMKSKDKNRKFITNQIEIDKIIKKDGRPETIDILTIDELGLDWDTETNTPLYNDIQLGYLDTLEVKNLKTDINIFYTKVDKEKFRELEASQLHVYIINVINAKLDRDDETARFIMDFGDGTGIQYNRIKVKDDYGDGRFDTVYGKYGALNNQSMLYKDNHGEDIYLEQIYKKGRQLWYVKGKKYVELEKFIKDNLPSDLKEDNNLKLYVRSNTSNLDYNIEVEYLSKVENFDRVNHIINTIIGVVEKSELYDTLEKNDYFIEGKGFAGLELNFLAITDEKIELDEMQTNRRVVDTGEWYEVEYYFETKSMKNTTDDWPKKDY